jgi:adenylate kinase
MIFVGGIHGVGKSFFCKKVSQKFNLLHYSSSALITEEKKEIFSTNKKINNLDKNQDLLLTAIQRHNLLNQDFLLDGHFCLLNKEGEVTRIPEETFNMLSPSSVIILIDSPEIIAERLSQRDKVEYDLDFIGHFQKEEVDYAQKITSNLEIPIHIIKSGESINNIQSLSNLLKNRIQS